MRRVLLLLAVSSLLICLLLAAKVPARDDRGPGEAPDRMLMQAINDAWCTLDPEQAAPYYDQAPGNVYYDVAPLKYTGWQAYARGAAEVLKGLRSMKYTVGDDAAVHVEGDLAWGTATLHLVTVDRQGRRDEQDLRWTPVWAKRDGSWLLVHEHLSAAAQPQP